MSDFHTETEIRFECLKLAIKTASFDTRFIIDVARAYEGFINGTARELADFSKAGGVD